MQLAILFIALFSAPAFASPSALVEFSVPGARYKLLLDGQDSRLDEVHKLGANEVWTRVYQGTLTSVSLPENARLEQIYGLRATAPGFLKYAHYAIDENSMGLRVKSGRNLVLLGPLGTTVLTFDDEVMEAKLLSRSPTLSEGVSYIFSLKGRIRQGTFLVIKSEGAQPYKISDHFQTSLSDNVTRHVFKTGPMINLRKWFKDPTAAQILDELIRWLDDREALLSIQNSEVLVRRAIRGILMREFPRLKVLESEDAEVSGEVNRLVDALVHLWQGREVVDGRLIRSSLITRLEAEVPDRARCELALLNLRGPGSHALGYYRGEALRAMNWLHRRLYRN